MANTVRVSEQIRANMRTKILNGAAKYRDKLIDKDFWVICKDGSKHNVRFFRKDFQHLTGLVSNLSSEEEFFDKCCDKTISVQNLEEKQHYDISTLKFKTKRIETIDEIVYGNTVNSLFMVNLHTKTGDYPVAIRNKDINTCIGFRDNINRARTLRKYNNSNDADEQLEIIAIFAKKPENTIYSEKVYLKDKRELLAIAGDIVDKISEDIKQDIVSAQSDLDIDSVEEIIEEVAATVEIDDKNGDTE